MRDIDVTGGQEMMKTTIVETTPATAERINVFRASPFEFDVTALPVVAIEGIGRPIARSGEPIAELAESNESWSSTTIRR